MPLELDDTPGNSIPVSFQRMVKENVTFIGDNKTSNKLKYNSFCEEI